MLFGLSNGTVPAASLQYEITVPVVLPAVIEGCVISTDPGEQTNDGFVIIKFIGFGIVTVTDLDKLQVAEDSLNDISSIAKSFPAEMILLSYIQISAVVLTPELQLIVFFNQLQTPPVEAGGAIETPLIRTSIFANVAD